MKTNNSKLMNTFGWAVDNCNILMIHSIRSTRKQCQDDFADFAGSPWSALRKSGNFRCVKVKISFNPSDRKSLSRV